MRKGLRLDQERKAKKRKKIQYSGAHSRVATLPLPLIQKYKRKKGVDPVLGTYTIPTIFSKKKKKCTEPVLGQVIVENYKDQNFLKKTKNKSTSPAVLCGAGLGQTKLPPSSFLKDVCVCMHERLTHLTKVSFCCDFHPDGWHRTWVSRRCIHSYSLFVCLPLQSPKPIYCPPPATHQPLLCEQNKIKKESISPPFPPFQNSTM